MGALFASCAILLAAGNGYAAGAAQPNVYTLDAAALADAKHQVEQNDPAVMPAYRKLLHAADAALAAHPFTVTDKRMVPPGGDKHDYLSLAPYWWPDPAKRDGLPYVRRDGRINPAVKNNNTDSRRIEDFSNAVGALGLGYYFTGDERYARHAALLLRMWFIDPATRMNPNLDYAQGVMGVVNGRGTGIIDTRHFWQVIDTIGLIAPSGALSDSERAALRQWFSEYTNWLLTSSNGRDERAARNNHGSYYDQQVVNQALFTGDLELARRVLQGVGRERIDVQIRADGRQPLELERTRAFHYSVFNLLALYRLARYGEQAGVDLWHYPDAQQPALRNALAYLTPYVSRPSTWPYQDIEGVAYADYLPLLLQARHVYGPRPADADALAELRGREMDNAVWLEWPEHAADDAAGRN
jgi:hypothetical protein